MYENRSDVYDEDKDPVDEISLANILVIESSTDDLLDFSTTHENDDSNGDEMIAPCIDCLFDVHARVQFGGDSQGIRVFSFYSDSQNNARNWMGNLCKAVGFLQLVPASGGGYVSVVSEAAISERRELQLRRQVSMMREGAGGDSLRKLASCTALSEAKGPVISALGRGRGRGRAFRGLAGPSGKHGDDYISPGKDVTLNRGFHSEPDELEYLSYDRHAHDESPTVKKDRYMADVHRNHFKEVGLIGGGTGRGRGGRGRGGRVPPVRTQGDSRHQTSPSAFTDVSRASHDKEEDDAESNPIPIPQRPPPPPAAFRSVMASRGRGRSGMRGIVESSCPF